MSEVPAVENVTGRGTVPLRGVAARAAFGAASATNCRYWEAVTDWPSGLMTVRFDAPWGAFVVFRSTLAWSGSA